jgi:hypothetical protein
MVGLDRDRRTHQYRNHEMTRAGPARIKPFAKSGCESGGEILQRDSKTIAQLALHVRYTKAPNRIFPSRGAAIL